MMDYKIHAENDSMYNTPPCWSIYICGLVFEKLLKQGWWERSCGWQGNWQGSSKLYLPSSINQTLLLKTGVLSFSLMHLPHPFFVRRSGGPAEAQPGEG